MRVGQTVYQNVETVELRNALPNCTWMNDGYYQDPFPEPNPGPVAAQDFLSPAAALASNRSWKDTGNLHDGSTLKATLPPTLAKMWAPSSTHLRMR